LHEERLAWFAVSLAFIHPLLFLTMSKPANSSTLFWLSAGRKALTAAVLTAFTLGFSSCKKEQIGAVPDVAATQSSPLQRLLDMGFAQKNIEDKGDYYLVEGDIRFDKSSLAVKPIATKPGVIAKPQDQVSGLFLIDFQRQPNVTVRIDASLPSQFIADAQQAIREWNSIERVRVNLNLTTDASADITIIGQNLNNGAFGEAPLPLNGTPGSFVHIDPRMPASFARLVITHELGHCLGFHHTDLYARGEDPGIWGAQTIPGTPFNDPNSIMNSGSAPNQVQGVWQGFSEFDVTGFRTLYPDTYYKIVARHSGKVLDVLNGYGHDGAAVIQFTYSGNTNEQWSLEGVGDGYYKIVARHSGKVLDVYGGSSQDGAAITQYTYSGSANQQWKLGDIGNGYYKIEARHSGKVLDVENGYGHDGASVIQYTYSGNTNQQWSFEPI
jgi:hypothetical protein